MAANNRRMSGKKGAQVGSGGQRRRGLEGKGPTPPAEARKGHKKNRVANAKAKQIVRRPAHPTAFRRRHSRLAGGSTSAHDSPASIACRGPASMRASWAPRTILTSSTATRISPITHPGH